MLVMLIQRSSSNRLRYSFRQYYTGLNVLAESVRPFLIRTIEYEIE